MNEKLFQIIEYLLFDEFNKIASNGGAMFSCRLRAALLSCRSEVVAG
ncbi:MAG: hypothetical protein RBS07_16135 [Lentimicrobium sp.]|nr:hypothetical protein [Lentimicrobium sp.]